MSKLSKQYKNMFVVLNMLFMIYILGGIFLFLFKQDSLVHIPIYSFVFILFFFSTLSLYDASKYDKNQPFKFKKFSKIKSIILGLLAAIHYTHMIGTYSHKKYNTQVFYPENLETRIGSTTAFIIGVSYAIAGLFITSRIPNFYLIILIFPVLTNIFSLIWNYISPKL